MSNKLFHLGDGVTKPGMYIFGYVGIYCEIKHHGQQVKSYQLLLHAHAFCFSPLDRHSWRKLSPGSSLPVALFLSFPFSSYPVSNQTVLNISIISATSI